MKRWETATDGGRTLTAIDVAEPDPVPGQVLVDLRAASLNFRDLFHLEHGLHPGRVPVSDGAGEVLAVGEGVSGFAVGERVVGSFFSNWTSGAPRHADLSSARGGDNDGVLSERVNFDASALVQIPAGLSYREASTFPCAGVTAWHALVGHQWPVEASDTVLTLGSGGVALFALQIARLRGANVIAMSSSEAKRARLLEMGAMTTLDYTDEEDWKKSLMDATDGRGVDFVMETGGAETLGRSLEACAVGGCVTLVGVLSGRATQADAGLIHGRELTFRSIYVGPTRMLEEVLSAFVASGARPVIDRSFPFEAAPEAFEYLGCGNHFGKVVIER